MIKEQGVNQKWLTPFFLYLLNKIINITIMSCILKPYATKIAKKHGLSLYSTEVFYQKYQVENGEASLNDDDFDKKFNEYIEYQKSRQDFKVLDTELFDKYNSFINNYTNNGYFKLEDTPFSEDELKSTFKEHINIWENENEDKEAKIDIPVNKDGYTQEMFDIKEKALKDGTFMKAPNGKSTNLNEKQWLQVRTKAFKEWFGDWEFFNKINETTQEYKKLFSFAKKDGIEEETKYIALFIEKNNLFYPNSNNEWDLLFDKYFEVKNKGYIVSKVVDNNGEPLVVYHITENEENKNIPFNIFNTKRSIYDKGSFFTSDKKYAESLAEFKGYKNPFIYEVFLNIKKPYQTENAKLNNNSVTKIIDSSYYMVYDNDGIIGHDEYNREHEESVLKKSNGYEYVVTNPNQIKSAIDNIGAFSKKNNDIYYENENIKNGKRDENLIKLKNEKYTTAQVANLLKGSEYDSIVKLLASLKKDKSIDKKATLIGDVEIKLVSEFDYYNGMENAVMKQFKGKRAYYKRVGDKKYIYVNAYANYENGDASSVILHELMHAITVEKILANPEMRSKFESIMDELYAATGNNEYDRNSFNAEGRHVLEEFIANIWTKKQVIEDLKNTKTTGEFQTLWDKIKSFFNEILHSVFGKVDDDSLFAKASTELINLIEKEDSVITDSAFYEDIDNTDDNTDDIEIEGDAEIGKDDDNDDIVIEGRRISEMELNTNLIDVDENSIHSKLHKWKNVTLLTSLEKRELSENVIQDMSDFINALYEEPELIRGAEQLKLTKEKEDRIIDGVKSGKLQRKDFVSKLKYENIISLYKENFLDFQDEEYKQIIDENWDAIIFNGRNMLKLTEGYTIDPAKRFIEMPEDTGEENADGSVEEYEGKEDEESEAYDIKADTRSATKSLSKEIRNILYTIKINDSETKWHTKRFEDGESLSNKLFEMLHSAQNVNDMIKRLESNQNIYKWIAPLLNKLKTEPYLKQKFFRDIRKSFIIRAILERKDGKLVPTIINYDKEITGVKMKSFTTLWKDGFRSAFISVSKENIYDKKNKDTKYETNPKDVEFIDKWIDRLTRHLNDSKEDINDSVALTFKKLLKNLGIDVDIDVVNDILKDENKTQFYDGDNHTKAYVLKKNMINMLKSLRKITPENPSNPLNLQEGNIEQYAREIFELIKPYERVWIEKSTMQKGKNYYGYIYPSFINDLFDKLKNVDSKDEDEYIGDLKAMYNDDYLLDKNGNFRNEILKMLTNSKNRDYREKFDKVSLLTFEDGEEIKAMTGIDELETDLSFFFNKSDGRFTYYNCGVFSNKEQIQYIKFRKYKNLDEIKKPFFNVLKQEIDRIKDVIQRAKLSQKQLFDDSKSFVAVDKYDIPEKTLKKILYPGVEDFSNLTDEQKEYASKKLSNLTGKDFSKLVKTGASFKHLSFINEMLFNEDNALGKLIRDIINLNSDNYGGTTLENEFYNLFKENGFMDEFFNKEVEALKKFLPTDDNGEYLYSDNELKTYSFNDFFAQIQFTQLFQIDLAYNKNAEDTQKRAAAFIAPGLKLDTTATFLDEKTKTELPVSDGKMRTVVINAEKTISDCIGVLKRIFTEKANEFFPGKTKFAQGLRDVLVTRLEKIYSEFDASDGQSWMSPTGFWKKLTMQGKADDKTKKIIDSIASGNLNLNDINAILGEPQKPVVYGFQNLTNQKGNFKNKCIPTYIKDSEVTILLADAIIRGAKEDSILTALFDIMEESHYAENEKLEDGNYKRSSYKNNGIDNFTMSSAFKMGLTGTIDLSDETINKNRKKGESISDVIKRLIYDKIYPKNDDGSVDYNNYNTDYVVEVSFDNYRIQQEVPAHLRGHKQQLGSQNRILSIADINPKDKYKLYGKEIDGYDLQMTYLNLCKEYFDITKSDIEELFGLTSERRAKWLNKIQDDVNKVDQKLAKKIAFNRLYKRCENGNCSFRKAFGITKKELLSHCTIQNGKIVKVDGVIFKYFKKGCLFNNIVNKKYVRKNKNDKRVISNWKPENCEFTKGERALILSNELIKQINSDSRYDTELIYAVSVNPETERFNVPFNDPINHTRIEQFICSIVKKRFNKQKIDGGPVVQVSSYGLSEDLNMRYYKKGSRKELVKTKKEFLNDKNLSKKYKNYDDYLYKEAGAIAYHEIAITIPWGSDIAETLIAKEDDEKGRFKKGELIQPDIAIDMGLITKEMLYSIGYRIPTENKSSIYPMKVVAFLPEEMGTCIMLPKEIVAVTGSDFDIDKTFIMFKSFYKDKNGTIKEYKYDKNNKTKGGINNMIFDIQMSIYNDEKMQFLMHNPQGFENIRKPNLLAQIKKSGIKAYNGEALSYKNLSKKTNEELQDIIDNLNIGNSNKNIHLASTRYTFFEKNMQGANLLGMFANNNTAHAFCQMHNNILRKEGKIEEGEREGMYVKTYGDDIILNGEVFNDVDRKLTIDGVLNRKGTNYISSATGEFVGASADIAKDDVLTEFGVNTKTINMVMLLIRAGFDHDFVCMFVNQPIVKRVLESENEKFTLNTYKSQFKNNHPNLIEDNYNGYKYTTEELFDHMTDDESESEYQYFIAKTLTKLLQPSKDLLTISLECRYNSIKNGVGPSLIDNIISTKKHEEFVHNDNITIENSRNIVEMNPLLNILYEEQYGNNSLVKRILGDYTTEYSRAFYDMIDDFLKISGIKLNKSMAKYFKKYISDYNYFRLTSEGRILNKITQPFLNQDYDSRLSLYNFPGKFQNFKKKLFEENIENDFMKMLFLNDWGDLCMNTKRMKSLQIDMIKSSLEELLNLKVDKNKEGLKKEASEWIQRCMLYFLQKKGFDFDPNGDVTIFPLIFKSNIKFNVRDDFNGVTFYDYTSNVNYGLDTNQDVLSSTRYNFNIQFFRNNPDIVPKQKLHPDKNKTWKIGGNEIQFAHDTIKDENGDDVRKEYVHIYPLKNKDEYGGYYPDFTLDYDDESFLPIIRINDNIYSYIKNSSKSGKLTYEKIEKLGNKSMKEYNALEDGYAMKPIPKIKAFINPFNENFDPKIIRNKYEKVYQMYDRNEVGKLSYMYHVINVGDEYNGITMTEELKNELYEMIKGTTYEDGSIFKKQIEANNRIKTMKNKIDQINLKDDKNYPYLFTGVYALAKKAQSGNDPSVNSQTYNLIKYIKSAIEDLSKEKVRNIAKTPYTYFQPKKDILIQALQLADENEVNELLNSSKNLKDIIGDALEDNGNNVFNPEYSRAEQKRVIDAKQAIGRNKSVQEILKENLDFVEKLYDAETEEFNPDITSVENDVVNSAIEASNNANNSSENNDSPETNTGVFDELKAAIGAEENKTKNRSDIVVDVISSILGGASKDDFNKTNRDEMVKALKNEAKLNESDAELIIDSIINNKIDEMLKKLNIC